MLALLSIACLSLSFSTLSMADPAGPAEIDPKIPLMLASERDSLPVEGELLYDCSDLGGYDFVASNGATLQITDASAEQEFGKKFQIGVTRAGTNAWEPQLMSPVNAIPVQTGDVLLYVFYIRTTDTESPNDFGQAAFYSQRASSPWTTLGSLTLSLSTIWKKLYVIAEAEENYGIGEMRCTFHLGYLQQDVEVGGVLALNLGAVDKDLLPTNEIRYEGMEPEASWREDAQQRIELHRKCDMGVRVLDGEGNPVENATVTMVMKDHHYGFGTFVSDILLDGTPDGGRYRSHVLDLFNVATTPFYMGGNNDNWGWYGSAESKLEYPKLAYWLQANQIPTKGHVLIWPGWNYMPSFFEALAGDPEGLRAAIDEHLETIVPIGKENGLYEWDVVNEPFINHDVMDILGESILIDWYNRVHELDSFPKLILNEYNIIMGGGRADFQANLERLLDYLIAEGAPVGGIGMQCHFDENLTGISTILQVLDRFSRFNLPIQITEFDVAIRDEAVQAEYLRDFYTAVFSHPSTEKIVMWGFYEKVMWKPLGALVRSNWTYKPNYEVYRDLIYNQWWSPDTTGSTDPEGILEQRAFKGYYQVTVETEDTTYVLENQLFDRDTLLLLQPPALPTSDNSGKYLDPADGVSGTFSPFPNPFSDKVTMTHRVEIPAAHTFRFYTLQGQLVQTREIYYGQAGIQLTTFELGHLPDGVYLCQVDTPGEPVERSYFRIVKNETSRN